MSWFLSWTRSSIGKKMVMAITGLILLLYVIAHMAGNLQIFISRDQINAYAVGLRELGPLLWIARGILLLAVLVHIATAVSLAMANRAARPVRYAMFKPIATSYAARTMIWSGLIIAAFVVYHVLHFTLHTVDTRFVHLVDQYGRHDVYSMVILGFHSYLVAGSYILAVGLLCAHLWHGIPSFLQSLGFNSPRYNDAVDKIGPALAVILFVGFASVPVAVMAGLLKLPPGVLP